jgi:dethiobiotin synthetase
MATERKQPPYKALWVVGTDTNVGKTVVSALLAQGLGASYWKPIQSGLDGPTDTDNVRMFTQLPSNYFLREAYSLKTPASPHLSARIDGVQIDLEKFLWPREQDIAGNGLIVEGAGGLMVPVNDSKFMIDLTEQLHAPVVVVCRSALGTINHTLLTINALKSRNIPIIGFIMNGEPHRENELAVEKYGNVSLLARIPHLESIDSEFLAQIWENENLSEKISF